MRTCWIVFVLSVQLLLKVGAFELLYPQNGAVIFTDSLHLDVDITGETDSEERRLNALQVQVTTLSEKHSLTQDVDRIARVGFVRKDGTQGLMISDVFRLRHLKAGKYEIQLRYMNRDGIDVAPLVVRQFEVVIPFVKLTASAKQTVRKAVPWNVEIPETFMVGRDGVLVFYLSERMDPEVISQTTNPGPFSMNLVFTSPGRFSLLATLVGHGPNYGDTKRILAMSELYIIDVAEENLSKEDEASRTKLVNWMFGPNFLIVKDDTFVGRGIQHYGVWCLSEIELFSSIYDSIARNSSESSLFFLDIGANIGSFTVPLGQHVGERGRVLAIEAHPQTFQVLTANVALSGLDNVDTFKFVVGSKSSMRSPSFETQIRPSNLGAHSFDSECFKCTSELWGNSVFKEEVVDLISLPKENWHTMDGIIEENYQLDFGKIALVKIDVEGFEVDVMRGFRKTVQQHRPPIFFEANRDDKMNELMDIFEELDYSLFWSNHVMHQGKASRNANVNIFPDDYSNNILAIPTEKLGDIREDPKLAVHLSENLRVKRHQAHRNVSEIVRILAVEALPRSEFGLASPNGEDGLLFSLFMRICARSRKYVELVAPSRLDQQYQPGKFTSMLERFFKFHGDAVEVDTASFSNLLAHRKDQIDLLIAMHQGIDLGHLCVLLCQGSCIEGHCDSEQQKLAPLKPRVILLHTAASGSSTKSHCADVATSRVQALKKFANSVWYKVIYCESTGQSCLLVSHEALFWDMIPRETQLTMESTFLAQKNLARQPVLHDSGDQCIEKKVG